VFTLLSALFQLSMVFYAGNLSLSVYVRLSLVYVRSTRWYLRTMRDWKGVTRWMA